MDSQLRPKVRFFNVHPLNGGYLLSDPYGISKEMWVNERSLFLISLMDGKNSIRDIKLQFLRATGILLTDEELSEFIKQLKSNLMLFDEDFERALEAKKRAFLSGGVRKPSHVNYCYPADKNQCEEFLKGEEFTDKVDAPAVFVPHMDLRVAKSTYWEAYGRLKGKKDLIVILGVSHYLHQMPISVFPADFETPFGILETDKEILEKLKRSFDFDITYDVLAYEHEHSVEFQTVYAKLLYPDAKVLAIIVSYGDKDFLKKAAEKLMIAVSGKENNVLFVSSVDMSHVGKKFGDITSFDPSYRDREYLTLLENMQGEEAFELLQKDNNRTRIDGQYTNIFFYYLLKHMGLEKGRLLDYKIYDEWETDSKVSYASMMFT